MKSPQRTEIDKRFLKSYRLLYADEHVHTKKDFCDQTGLLPQNISMMERGQVSATVDNIYNLVTRFGVSLDWIFFGTGSFYANS